MNESAANLVAIMLGVGVFLVIVAVGWRSVQHRRILRLQGPDGHETIIVAGEDDEVSSVATTTTETTQPAASPATTVRNGTTGDA